MLSPATLPEADPKKLVHDYDISEKDLAKMLGVSYSLVRKWFCNDREPQLCHRITAGLILQNLNNGLFEVK